jgi:hypothetical protein
VHASAESEVSIQKEEINKELKCVFSHENFHRRFQVRAGREDVSNHQLKMIIFLKLVMIVGLV